MLLTAASIGSSSAAPVEFTIDEAQSKITLSGKAVGNTVKEQGPGSLVTSFYGKILADVSAGGIQFTGGSTVTARTNGVWKPGPKGASGSAPADYAAQASSFLGTILGAVRNIVLDVNSAVLPVAGGKFDASALIFGFPTNGTASFDYDAGFLGSKGIPLTGLSTNRVINGATLSAQAPLTLVIQIDTEFTFKVLSENDSTVHLTGNLIATQSTAAQVTIGSIEIKDGKVILHVQGAGTGPRLEGSTDLVNWTNRTPTSSSDGTGTVLTLPVGGVQEFYRIVE